MIKYGKAALVEAHEVLLQTINQYEVSKIRKNQTDQVVNPKNNSELNKTNIIRKC